MDTNWTPWHPRPADKIIRRPRADQLHPVHIEVTPRRARPLVLNPPLILVYAFAALVGIGTTLLVMPFAHKGDGFAPFIDALFTATSAATVTGLVTQDTPSFWTIPGQAVIMVLMFAGGLGIMTIVGSLFVLAGQRTGLTQRMVMRETIGTSAFDNITRITVQIILGAVAIQLVGFLVLLIRLVFLYTLGDAAWHALFQAVSGFNNAGFTSLPESSNLSAFQTDIAIVGPIAVLVVLGSLSYLVMRDVVVRRRFPKFTLNTKLVLVFTGALLLVGTAIFYLFEVGNDGSIGRLSSFDKLVAAVFHSVNRTAGFTTVDFGQTTDQTNLFYAVLMAIGGASASVAGGIKVNTFAVFVIALLVSFRGQTSVSAFGRTIPDIQVRWAMVLVVLSFIGVALVTLTLTAVEQEYPFLDLMFEAVSAYATVGLSTGLTGDLSIVSKLVLTLAMFIGRVVPPMVIVVALSQQQSSDLFRYPRENVVLG
jgi:trk system potassium uptake protein TrkH